MGSGSVGLSVTLALSGVLLDRRAAGVLCVEAVAHPVGVRSILCCWPPGHGAGPPLIASEPEHVLEDGATPEEPTRGRLAGQLGLEVGSDSLT